MPELELALVELGRELRYPETPDLEPRVREQLAAARRRHYGLDVPRRRGLALLFAALVAALAAAFAVPQSRAAILELLGLRGVTIQRVEELPPVPTKGPLILGTETTLEQAAGQAGFQLLVPAELGEPDRVYFSAVPSGGMVSLLYGDPDTPRALFTQFRGAFEDALFKKVIAETRVEPVEGVGDIALWLAGAPHSFSFVDAEGRFTAENVRLAGNVLLWQEGPLTFRLEADLTKGEAAEIARSARPYSS